MSEKLTTMVADQCDVLHLAFGGLGGHRAVVEELSTVMALGGLRPGAIFISPANAKQTTERTPGLEFAIPVEIKRRADLSSMVEVARTVRRLRPRCVIAHTYRHIPAAWFGLVLARRRPKIIMVEHQSVVLRRHIDEVQSLIGALFSVAVVFLSKDYEDSYRIRGFLRFLKKRTAVIPNGINVQHDSVPRPIGNRTLVIGMASRLIPSKRVDKLIEAMSELCAPKSLEGEEWLLRIAGDGPDRSELEAQVSSLELQANVIFNGPLERHEMASWFLSIDCYVQVSEGETMSMSILEAASYGLPIVAIDEPSIRQVFEPGKSIVLVHSTNAHAIASVLRSIRFSNTLREIGREAQEIVRKNFSSRKMAVGYLELLRTVKALPSEDISNALVQISQQSD